MKSNLKLLQWIQCHSFDTLDLIIWKLHSFCGFKKQKNDELDKFLFIVPMYTIFEWKKY